MNGTVSGGGLTCGAGGAVCQVDVASGTSVTLTATPMSGYSLTNWGGSCSGTGTTTTVLMSAARTCTATFAVGLPTGPPYTMTISPKPTGGTIAGAGLNCGTGGNLCAVTMPASMGLGMSAAPDAGYNFGAWTGDCSGLTTSLTVQLSGPRTCSATFIPVGTTFQLNVSPAPTGGTVTGGGITCGYGRLDVPGDLRIGDIRRRSAPRRHRASRLPAGAEAARAQARARPSRSTGSGPVRPRSPRHPLTS